MAIKMATGLADISSSKTAVSLLCSLIKKRNSARSFSLKKPTTSPRLSMQALRLHSLKERVYIDVKSTHDLSSLATLDVLCNVCEPVPSPFSVFGTKARLFQIKLLPASCTSNRKISVYLLTASILKRALHGGLFAHAHKIMKPRRPSQLQQFDSLQPRAKLTEMQ